MFRPRLAIALTLSLFLIPACAVSQSVAIPETPAPVKDILFVRPFTLAAPYRNDWSRERPAVSTGTLVVLEVDPALVRRRDTLEPVLYAANTTVIRLNHGDKSGRVIGIVPGNIDLTTAPIWFGSPQLPERVTAADVRAERERAEKAGVRPFPPSRIGAVQKPPVNATDLAALLRDVAAALVDQYSPDEKELADQWRLPTASAPPKRQKP